MEIPTSSDDCYFYYYSSCTKGEECPYRHCKEALGTEITCSLWREGRCFRDNCKFRHMESRINRTFIPCYWENQPGGCRKPHCVFMHRKHKNTVTESIPLILPVSNGSPAVQLAEVIQKSSPHHSPRMRMQPEEEEDFGVDSNVPSVPVEPIVVNFDEESDTESVSNMLIKNPGSQQNYPAKKHSANPNENFGVKTLEQIKMEKIHKESEHFYKYNDEAVSSPQCYPPKSDFISLTDVSSQDKSLPTACESTQSLLKEENDLRERLFKKRTSMKKAILSKNVTLEKNVISFKQQGLKKEEFKSESFNFKVKTLAEIRKERESQKATAIFKETVSTPCQNGNLKNTHKLKVTRTAQHHKIEPKLIEPTLTESELTKPEHEEKQDTSFVKPENQTGTKTSIAEPIVEIDAVSSSNARVSDAENLPETTLVSSSMDEEPERKIKAVTAKRKESENPEPQSKSKLLKIDPTLSHDSTMLTESQNEATTKSTDDTSLCESSSQEPDDVRKSVDELDDYLDDVDMSVDGTETDDILLEIEQFLDS